MYVTRDPNQEHISNGGGYIGNMGACEFYLDGDRLDTFCVIAADNEKMFVDLIKRDDEGYPLIVDGVLHLERKEGNTVSFHCPEDGCVGCTKSNRVKRQSKKWWLL